MFTGTGASLDRRLGWRAMVWLYDTETLKQRFSLLTLLVRSHECLRVAKSSVVFDTEASDHRSLLITLDVLWGEE